VNILKLLAAHLLLTYDFRIPDGKVLPDWWFETIMEKDPRVEVEFRRRM
jgi:hypothetical protein